jgi:hypothetical protein
VRLWRGGARDRGWIYKDESVGGWVWGGVEGRGRGRTVPRAVFYRRLSREMKSRASVMTLWASAERKSNRATGRELWVIFALGMCKLVTHLLFGLSLLPLANDPTSASVIYSRSDIYTPGTTDNHAICCSSGLIAMFNATLLRRKTKSHIKPYR